MSVFSHDFGSHWPNVTVANRILIQATISCQVQQGKTLEGSMRTMYWSEFRNVKYVQYYQINNKGNSLALLKKASLDYRAVDISFRRAATQILKSSSNAPLALNRGVEQAERTTVMKESVLWGCPGQSFKANLPFIGMMQFFAALLKEISTAFFTLISKR